MSPSISGVFATYFWLLCCLSVLMTYTELLHFPITCYSSLTMLMVLTLNYVLIYIHVAIHAGFVFSTFKFKINNNEFFHPLIIEKLRNLFHIIPGSKRKPELKTQSKYPKENGEKTLYQNLLDAVKIGWE